MSTSEIQSVKGRGCERTQTLRPLREAPHLTPPERLSAEDIQRLRCTNDALLRAAAPYLRMLSRAAGDERHAVVLAERGAVVLDVRGDVSSEEGSVATHPLGSRLAEAMTAEVATNPGRFLFRSAPLFGAEGALVGLLGVWTRSATSTERLGELLPVAAKGVGAELAAGDLRGRVAELLSSEAQDAVTLEQLYQDMVQVYTAGRLDLERASLGLPRPSNVACLLCKGLCAFERFERLTSIWWMLASPEPWQGVELATGSLLLDVTALLHTEAAIAGVALEAAAAPDGAPRLHAGRAVRALVKRTTAAMRKAGRGGAVAVSVSSDARVTWAIRTADGPAKPMRYNMAKGSPWSRGF